jgi:hypothetical protein
MMSQHLLESFKLVSSALATPSIAVFAAWIAYHQYRIQKYRLIFDLREKRLKVFYALRQLVSDACMDSSTNQSSLSSFRLSVIEAPFFFNPNVVSYAKDLEERFLRMLELRDLIDDRADGNDHDLEDAKRELREIRQSMRQEHSRLQDQFRPYLELPADYLKLPATSAAVVKW